METPTEKEVVRYELLLVGRRGAYQSICWISPFITAGYHVGRILRIPQLLADQSACTSCGQCDRKCSMSIPVSSSFTKGSIETSDCILCGECVDTCKKKVLSYGITRSKH